MSIATAVGCRVGIDRRLIGSGECAACSEHLRKPNRVQAIMPRIGTPTLFCGARKHKRLERTRP
jgi:hypothetical protein